MTTMKKLLAALTIALGAAVAGQTVPRRNETKANLHVVMHTHDDTGWLLTVDQYHYQQVRFILDTIVDRLLENPLRKMVYAEMAFFARWWEDQDEHRKRDTRRLVADGQLEFVNGGWCMHDEATPYYVEMIDQTTRGHQFILREFGPHAAPRATWSIDPFGHTNTQAWLLSADAGMPSVFFGRMNGRDRAARFKSHRGEWIWLGSRSRGRSAQTFASTFFGNGGGGHYVCPVDFEQYGANQVIDNPARHDNNVKFWVDLVVDQATRQLEAFHSSHILWACGMDFNFKNAATWFRNMDALMRHVNEDGRVNMFYSTPSQYVAEKFAATTGMVWEARMDDLIPYEGAKHDLWTGYYSSKVAFKRFLRKSSALLQTARQLHALSDVQAPLREQHYEPEVGSAWYDSFEGAVGLAMHHDGISGTEKQVVQGDYAQRIIEGQSQVEQGLSSALGNLMGVHLSLVKCRDINITACAPTTDARQSFVLSAWNPQGRPTAPLLSVPVGHTVSRVLAFTEDAARPESLAFQLTPIDDRTRSLGKLYLNRFGLDKDQIDLAERALTPNATHWLWFRAPLPALGYATFKVVLEDDRVVAAGTAGAAEPTRDDRGRERQAPRSFDNGKLRLTLDPDTNELRTLTHLGTGQTVDFGIEWGWYQSSEGGCTEFGCDNKKSGAYVFRPQNSNFSFPGARPAKLPTTVIQGPLVTEIRQELSEWVSHTVRLRKDAPYVEVDYVAGPIPMLSPWLPASDPAAKRRLGKELGVRYSTSLQSNARFSTDSNGRELVTRVRGQRPASYPQPYENAEPIASNFYPVTSLLALQDEKRDLQLCVVTDSTQGGTSLHDGQLELMVHRRNYVDDDKGLKEPLNETMCGCQTDPGSCHCDGLAVRGSHRLLFGPVREVARLRRQVNQDVQFEPSLMFAADAELGTTVEVPVPTFSALADPQGLPPNVALTTLSGNYAKSLGPNKLLLRLDHLYAVDEDPDGYSAPVKVNLSTLFATRRLPWRFVSAQEVTLTGNLPIEDKLTYDWNLGDSAPPFASWAAGIAAFDPISTVVHLEPQQVRTFVVTVSAVPVHSAGGDETRQETSR